MTTSLTSETTRHQLRCGLCGAADAADRPGRLGRYAQTCDDCESRRGTHLGPLPQQCPSSWTHSRWRNRE